MENIIEIKHLHKSFKDVHAVNDLSLNVKEGELFAFLGVNGAGKSTTIQILTGMLSKDEGEVFIDGMDVTRDFAKISKEIGVVFQNSILDQSLSVYDNLVSRAALYGIVGKAFKEKLEELSSLLNFKGLLKRGVGKLSGGERRRIDVARALLLDPKLLILDEPSTGLDPQTRKNLWEVIDLYRKKKGMTVLLTTHYMEETTDADYVVILDSGRIVASGTPLELKNKYTGDFITVYNPDLEKCEALSLPYQKVPDGIRIEVKDTKEARDLILAHPSFFLDFEITKGKMDDVFLSATGKKLEEESK